MAASKVERGVVKYFFFFKYTGFLKKKLVKIYANFEFISDRCSQQSWKGPLLKSFDNQCSLHRVGLMDEPLCRGSTSCFVFCPFDMWTFLPGLHILLCVWTFVHFFCRYIWHHTVSLCFLFFELSCVLHLHAHHVLCLIPLLVDWQKHHTMVLHRFILEKCCTVLHGNDDRHRHPGADDT